MLDKLNIDCVAGHFTQLLNLVRGFCVDMAARLLDRCVPRACVTGQPSNQGGRGVVRSLLTAGTVFESIAGTFLRIRSDMNE